MKSGTDRLLTPQEAAGLLFVHPNTLNRWARMGLVPAIRTPGGHRRYRESDLVAAAAKGRGFPWPWRPWTCPGCGSVFAGHECHAPPL